MKTSTVFIGACGIVAGVLLQPAVVCAQASDEAQIRALEDNFAAGIRVKDLDAIMRLARTAPELPELLERTLDPEDGWSMSSICEHTGQDPEIVATWFRALACGGGTGGTGLTRWLGTYCANAQSPAVAGRPSPWNVRQGGTPFVLTGRITLST